MTRYFLEECFTLILTPKNSSPIGVLRCDSRTRATILRKIQAQKGLYK